MVDGEADWRERAIRDAVLAGDMAAWRAWYAEYFDRMAAYVRWRCGGLADLADDAIQETWLTAVRRLRSSTRARTVLRLVTWHRGERDPKCTPVAQASGPTQSTTRIRQRHA